MTDVSKDPDDDWDPTTYSVYGLLAAGSRFTDDYDEDAAVRQYLRLHPGAVESQVRAELTADVARHGG